jgi:RNA methyltransferase, TrmH family
VPKPACSWPKAPASSAKALRAAGQAETVVIAADMADRPQIAALARDAEKTGARVVLAPERLMSKITQKDNAQSVVAAFRQRHLAPEALPAPKAGAPLYVALYEVRDPGNLGTILRTADCAGASGVILIGTCCDPYSFEAVRASMGSLFDMPFANASFAAFDAWRRKQGLPSPPPASTARCATTRRPLPNPPSS